MKKVLSIQGGGILDISILYALLKLCLLYQTKNKEFYNEFQIFSGVSSGAILVSAIVLREKVFENVKNSDEYLSILEFWNNDIGKTFSVKITKILIYIYITKKNLIFDRSPLYTLISLNGLLFSKYQGNKKNVINQYLNYNLSDIPKNRMLVIKSYDIRNVTIKVYTNSKNINQLPKKFNGNIITTNISQVCNYSSNAPTYFPVNDSQIDGGTIINDAITVDQLLFKNEKTKILSLGLLFTSEITGVNTPFFDGILGWLSGLRTIFLKFPTFIQKQIITYNLCNRFLNETIFVKELEIDSLSENDINFLIEQGKKKNIKPILKFLN